MKEKNTAVIIGEGDVPIIDIIRVARGEAEVVISSNPSFRTRMEQSKKMLHQAMDNCIPVYGVTTGYGKSCGKRLAREVALKNGEHLLRFHGCGTGTPINTAAVRSAMMSRLLCLSRGYSGVSMGLLDQIAAFLNKNITPVIPCEGSVGASGDLTPMSYVAAALTGERDVFYNGKRMPAAMALEEAGLTKYVFEPKEPLAIINGTAAMTGIALIVIDRAKRIIDSSIIASALAIHAMKGNVRHFHPTISSAKPHPGQSVVAGRLVELLETQGSHSELQSGELESLQDPYSLRCSPQIVGVLVDALQWINTWIEIEANSNNDNPIFDPDSGEVLMGGNFYGGHVVFAMDSLKTVLASVADMADRQMALMCNPNVNRGLPADLVRNSGEKLYNHGFKAMSIATSALAAEALKCTMPAGSFSRSTESHNQDKVSMGTIAARDAERVSELVERTIAIEIIAAAQACEIRGNVQTRPRIAGLVKKIRSLVEPTIDDRPMDSDIEKIRDAIEHSDLFLL